MVEPHGEVLVEPQEVVVLVDSQLEGLVELQVEGLVESQVEDLLLLLEHGDEKKAEDFEEREDNIRWERYIFEVFKMTEESF